MRWLIVVLAAIGLVAAGERQTEAVLITYEASTGLLPEGVGWAFTDENNPSSSVSVADGILTHVCARENRAFWSIDLVPLGASADPGLFMECVVKVVHEAHQPPGDLRRGVEFACLGHATEMSGSTIIMYANEDRVFVMDDLTQNVLAEILFDTTERFHAYRIELNWEQFRLFLDGGLAASGTTK